MNITFKQSPNYDENRKTIDRVVIHWIVGNISAADAQFAKPNSTSAHYAVEDETVHQYVKEEHVAYHAGNYPMNQRSIGIEHSATPDRPASDTTYETSGELIADICKRHNIPLDRAHIIKHSEVVSTQCCGTVDVDRLITEAKKHTQPTIPSLTPEQRKAIDEYNKLIRLLGDNQYYKDDIERVVTTIKDREKERDEALTHLEDMKKKHEEELKDMVPRSAYDLKVTELTSSHEQSVLLLQDQLTACENKPPQEVIKVVEMPKQYTKRASRALVVIADAWEGVKM